MFGFFRRKREATVPAQGQSDVERLLSLPAEDLIQAYSETIKVMDSASKAMLILAYPTAQVLMDVMVDQGVKKRGAGLPTTYQDAVRFAFSAARDSETETGSRRAMWLALAAMLVHVSRQHPERHLNEIVASIWMSLFESKEALKSAVEHNILFDDQEKAYFRPTTSDRTFSIAMATVAPKHLRRCDAWDHEYI
jgi:hypothetical protein